MDRLDIEDRWPELFAPLDQHQRSAVVQTLAAAWHEGWVPSKEGVTNLIDKVTGVIDYDEYLRRVDAAAETHRRVTG